MDNSACNTLKGKIKRITLGAVNTKVIVELPNGGEVALIITKAPVERLGLIEGKKSMSSSRPAMSC